jgi:hypothetical protein
MSMCCCSEKEGCMQRSVTLVLQSVAVRDHPVSSKAKIPCAETQSHERVVEAHGHIGASVGRNMNNGKSGLSTAVWRLATGSAVKGG